MVRIVSLPLLMVLFLIVVAIVVIFFVSLNKDRKEEMTQYNALSEAEKQEYRKQESKDMQAKQESAVANSISGNRTIM